MEVTMDIEKLRHVWRDADSDKVRLAIVRLLDVQPCVNNDGTFSARHPVSGKPCRRTFPAWDKAAAEQLDLLLSDEIYETVSHISKIWNSLLDLNTREFFLDLLDIQPRINRDGTFSPRYPVTGQPCMREDKYSNRGAAVRIQLTALMKEILR